MYVDGQAGNPLTRNRANKVYLHPFSGEVVHVQRSAELSAAEFITDMADPLHFGYFGGMATKIPWFIFGLAISFSVLSGTYLWYIRHTEKMERRIRRLSKHSADRTQDAVPPGRVQKVIRYIANIPPVRGALFTTLLTIVYLGIVASASINGIAGYAPESRAPVSTIEHAQVGPWSIHLFSYPSGENAGQQLLGLEFLSGGMPNFSRAELRVTTADSLFQTELDRNTQLAFRFYKSARPIPGTGLSELEITISTHSGETYVHRVAGDLLQQTFLSTELVKANAATSSPEFPETPLLSGYISVCSL
ncbi:MAG: PepSY-associated TM helix domain-containing protein [Balneolaceae bacterium]|nr:PepSY-associated TM helix domain-containing protein [Balneolaceae bacterium]